MAALRVPICHFQHARDVLPRPDAPSYGALGRLLAPESPPVRTDLLDRAERSVRFLHRLAEQAIRGEPGSGDGQGAWAAELAAVAERARSAGEGEESIVAAVRRRRDAMAEGLICKAKLSLPCWSPTVYKPGATRGAGGVEAVTCLVLDYDDGTSAEEALRPWADWPAMLCSTWNHTAEQPRYRVVLVLGAPAPAWAWPRVWRWAWERSGGHIDPACKDPSRLYLLPAIKRADAAYERVLHDPGGELLWLDWERLPDPDPPCPAAPAMPVPRVRVPEEQAFRLARQRLREDLATRERAANWLGAKVGPRRADHILCPRCGRPSVWFWLAPGAQSTATCAHRNSCGWWGHLDELLDAVGSRHAA